MADESNISSSEGDDISVQLLVNLPRDVLCERNDPTKITFSEVSSGNTGIKKSRSFVHLKKISSAKVGKSSGSKSVELDESNLGRSKSNLKNVSLTKSGKSSGSKSLKYDEEKSDEADRHISEKRSLVNVHRHKSCHHHHHDTKKHNVSDKNSISSRAGKQQSSMSAKGVAKMTTIPLGRNVAGTSKQKPSKHPPSTSKKEENLSNLFGKMESIVDKFDDFTHDLTKQVEVLSKRVQNLERK